MPGKRKYQKKSQMKKLIKKVNRIDRTLELKRYQQNWSGNAGSDYPLRPLFQMAQGLGTATRIGNKITCTSASLNMLVQWKQTATAATSIRVMVICDKASQGALPVTGDVLYYPSALGTIAQRNTINIKRFSILYDKVINNRNVTASAKQTTHNFRVKCSRVAEFLNSAGGTASLGQNMYYVLVTSNQGIGSADSPLIDFVTTSFYKDA